MDQTFRDIACDLVAISRSFGELVRRVQQALSALKPMWARDCWQNY